MKIVRLRLNLTATLLEEMNDLKVVYLVRDPRGVMNSRLGSVDWCSRSVDCIEPARLCSDVSSDLDSFEVLKDRFPDRVALVKYETLAKEPQTSFESLFSFAGLSYLQRIRTIVDRHTSRDVDQVKMQFTYSFQLLNNHDLNHFNFIFFNSLGVQAENQPNEWTDGDLN